jgi:hypothetical protein
MAKQPLSKEWTEKKGGLEQSIDKYKQLMADPGPIQTTLDTLIEKFDKFESEKMYKLKSNTLESTTVSADSAPVKEVVLKQKLLNSLPEPLKTILAQKDLNLDELQKILFKIGEKLEKLKEKKDDAVEEDVLDDDIREIIQGYVALDRIRQKNTAALEHIKNQEVRDFCTVCTDRPTIVGAEKLTDALPALIQIAAESEEVTLDNIVKKLEEKISSKESSLDELPEFLKQEAKAHVFKTLGKRDNWQYFKDESSLANQTMKEFIKLQSTPEFQMMTDEQKHMAWAQTFQEKIVDKTTNSEDLDKLFNIFNNEKYNKESHQNIKKLLDTEICEDLNSKTQTNQDSQQPYTLDQIPALRQELNFFGDYIRISQQALAQRSLRTMYSQFEVEKLPPQDKANYQEYLKLKASVEQLAMPDCVKTTTPSIPPAQLISVAGKALDPAPAADSDADAILEVSDLTILDPKLQSSNSAEIKDANLKRLSELNLAQAWLTDLELKLSEKRIELLKTISGGEQYGQDRQLLSKALQSGLFKPEDEEGFKDLFHQNHGSFLQAYAEEKRKLVGLINKSNITPQDISEFQERHQDDFQAVQKLARLESEIEKNDKIKEILPVTARIQELTRVSADLKNKYDSVVILGNLKPVEITAPSEQVSQLGGTVIEETQKPYRIPLAGGITLHDDMHDTTFEIKKLGDGKINFGRSDDPKMTEDQKNKLFISLSENILANWSPGKNVVLDVKNTDDALAFYYCMKKMSENFQKIHEEKKYKSSDFSMNDVKVRVDGDFMDTSGLKNLAEKQDSWMSPLGKTARLTTIGREIEQSMAKHPYRHVAEQRFKNEVFCWKSEIEKLSKDGEKVDRAMGVEAYNRLKKQLQYLPEGRVEVTDPSKSYAGPKR